MDGNWNNVTQTAVTNLGLCAKVCQAGLENSEIADTLQKFENLAKEYCKLDLEHQAIQKSIQKTRDYYNNRANDFEVPPKKTFENFYKTLKPTSDENIEKHELINKYYEQIDEIDEQSEKVVHQDDEIESVVAFIPPTDPITKAAIRHPVKNKECGHIYERDTILEIISKRNTRCPYLGCPAVHYILKSNLVEDGEMRKKIENYFLEKI